MIKRITLQSLATPIIFLILCLITYGLLIPWLGFYWDDWPFLWFAHTLGPSGLIDALAGDRPFLAAIYMFTTSLLGEQPLAWQIFAIFTRWLMTLALWWTLLQIWPGQRRTVTWVALTFTVFPGFQQSWISVIYSQAFLLLAAFLLSLGVMVRAVRNPEGWRSRRYALLTLAAMLLSAFAFFSTEYFFGIELVRPLLILFVLAEGTGAVWPQRGQITKALAHWSPYLVEFVVFILYRTLLSPQSAYPVKALDEFSTSLTATLWDGFKTALANAFTAGWTAWTQVFSNFFEQDWSTEAARLFGVVVIGSLVALLGAQLLRRAALAQSVVETRWALQAMLLGALALLAASLPFWAAGLPLSLTFPYDRFNLAMMFGASLLLVGILEFFIRTLRQKIVLLALVLSLTIGFQFRTANTFRRDWQNMQELMWQITWRMPGLQPDTMLLTHEFPLKYYSDNSLSTVVNWIYAPENHTRSMPYILNYITVRLNGSLPGLEPGLEFSQTYRAMRFNGSTSRTVVLSYAPPGCLRILDPVYANGNSLPGLNRILLNALPLTNFDQIITDPATPAVPPERWFGTEATHVWCYYFEKADLARQQGDWQTVAALGREVLDKNRKPGDHSEWMVFMEGFAHTGDWEQAVALGVRMMQNNPRLKEGVCQTWERILQQTDPDEAARAAVADQQAAIGCSSESQP